VRIFRELDGESVEGNKGSGFNLNFASEKALKKPKKTIEGAKPEILISCLNLTVFY